MKQNSWLELLHEIVVVEDTAVLAIIQERMLNNKTSLFHGIHRAVRL